MHIVQPRCNADRLWRSSQWSMERLSAVWLPALLASEQAAQAADAALHPGDHCKFCPAKPNCPALRERALATARSVFTDLTLTAPPVQPVSPVNLSPEQLAVVLAGADLVETWIKGCREMAFDTLKRGGEIPGWKLVAKQGLRKWTDDNAAADALRAAGAHPFTDPKIISPAEAEKRLAKTQLGKKGGEALVETLAFKPTTGEALVPVTDSRPALLAGSVFTPIEA
jgi:hypothetical protein